MIKTNVQESSLEAYSDLKSSGKQLKQTELILSGLSPNRDYTLREIQRITKFEINVISGRVNDLKKSGDLVHAGAKRICSITGKLVQPVKLPSKQLDLLEAA